MCWVTAVAAMRLFDFASGVPSHVFLSDLGLLQTSARRRHSPGAHHFPSAAIGVIDAGQRDLRRLRRLLLAQILTPFHVEVGVAVNFVQLPGI